MDETTVEQQEQQAEQALHTAVQSLEQRLDAQTGAAMPFLSLLVRLSVKTGWYAGIGFDQASGQHFAAIDLPGGQVSWVVSENNLAMLDGVPLYDKPFQAITSDVLNQRMLNARV